MPAVDECGQGDRPRVVLLGASNLTLGISTITQLARQRVGGACDLFIALGHGRSYGQWSTVLGRQLPGILECDLWEALAAAPAGPTYAMVTDVGNDIAYCVEPDTIARWLADAVARLRAHDARIVMTALPMESIKRLGPMRFDLFRRLYFPHRPLNYATMQHRVAALDEAMRRMAQCGDIRLAEQSGRWYGFDPIHLRMWHWNNAWAGVLAHWHDDVHPNGRAATRPDHWLSLLTATPTKRVLWGMQQARTQPTRRLPDGSTISFF